MRMTKQITMGLRMMVIPSHEPSVFASALDIETPQLPPPTHDPPALRHRSLGTVPLHERLLRGDALAETVARRWGGGQGRGRRVGPVPEVRGFRPTV